MQKFKAGDKIEMTEDYLGIKKGTILTVTSRMGVLYVVGREGSTCSEPNCWQLIEKTFDNLGVGDELTAKDDDDLEISTVEAIVGNLVAISWFTDIQWYTKEALKDNFNLADTTPEYTIEEAEKKFNIRIK